MPTNRRANRNKAEDKPLTKFSAEDWKYPEPANSPGGKPWPVHLRRRKLDELMHELGFHNLNKTQIAEEFGCSRQTLYTDFEWIYKQGVDPNTVKLLQRDARDIHHLIKKKLSQELLQTKDGGKMATLAHELREVLREEREWATSFGVMQPIPIAAQIDHTLEIRWADASDAEILDQAKKIVDAEAKVVDIPKSENLLSEGIKFLGKDAESTKTKETKPDSHD